MPGRIGLVPPHTTRRAAPCFIFAVRHAQPGRACRAGLVPAHHPPGRARVHICGAARPAMQAERAGPDWIGSHTPAGGPRHRSYICGPARPAGPSVEISQIRSRGEVCVTLHNCGSEHFLTSWQRLVSPALISSTGGLADRASKPDWSVG